MCDSYEYIPSQELVRKCCKSLQKYAIIWWLPGSVNFISYPYTK